MITIIIQDRLPLLGELKFEKDNIFSDPQHVKVVYSPFGRRVKRAWNSLSHHYPKIETWRCEIMPDHLHAILFVKEEMEEHLSVIVNGFKTIIRNIYKEMFPKEAEILIKKLSAAGDWRKNEKGLVLEHGYNDSILKKKDQLNRWYDYLRCNPFRLAAKRAFPDLFRTKRGLRIGTKVYDSIGNCFLAHMPWKVQVQLSRSLTEEEIGKAVERFMALADEGAVMVSPALSPGEKRVMRAVLDAGYQGIFISCTGFNNFTKVPAEYQEACSEGRFLMVSDLVYSNRNNLRREDCLRLNSIAEEIAGLGSSSF